MASIFSKIVKGEIPAYKILEDDKFLAFLDVFPLVPGHTLVIPKKEVDYIFDIDDVLLGEMFIFSKKVAVAIKESIPCIKVGMTVIGLEVPHAHIHLVPMQSVDDVNFTRDKLTISAEEMQRITTLIRSNLMM
jgi:histidine triad (HIT) family protein